MVNENLNYTKVLSATYDTILLIFFNVTEMGTEFTQVKIIASHVNLIGKASGVMKLKCIQINTLPKFRHMKCSSVYYS